MTATSWQRKIKRWPGWVLLAAVVVTMLAVGAARDAGPRTPQERVEAISKRVACPICDGESVFESRNNNSAAIRAEIAKQVDANVLSDDEIVDYLVQSFGEDVSLLPRSDGLDALVWVLPAVAFVAAAVGMTLAFRRWRSTVAVTPDDADRQLVDQALRREQARPVGKRRR